MVINILQETSFSLIISDYLVLIIQKISIMSVIGQEKV